MGRREADKIKGSDVVWISYAIVRKTGYSEEKNLNLSIRLRKAALNRRPRYQHSIWGIKDGRK